MKAPMKIRIFVWLMRANKILTQQFLDSGGLSSDETIQNLAQFLETNQKTLGVLHQLDLAVSSFNFSSQLPLIPQLNVLMTELGTVQKLAQKCKIQVPMRLSSELPLACLIDDGKNPDELTRDVINSCIPKNQITKGKTDAFKSLRKYLLEDLEQAFPDEVEAYREMRAISAAVGPKIQYKIFRDFK